MGRAEPLAIVLGAALAWSGCDARDLAVRALAALGHPTFREIGADEARRWVAGGALLLQARGEDPPVRCLPGATLVRPDGALAAAPAERRIVVVAEDPALGLGLGARLARAGVTRVAVVSGGLPVWEPGPREK